jgi:hypothetical protein
MLLILNYQLYRRQFFFEILNYQMYRGHFFCKVKQTMLSKNQILDIEKQEGKKMLELRRQYNASLMGGARSYPMVSYARVHRAMPRHWRFFPVTKF